MVEEEEGEPEQRICGRKSLQTGIPGPPALPPSLHSPAFVTVESVEEVRPSFCHRGAGELREAGRQELELREHLGSP